MMVKTAALPVVGLSLKEASDLNIVSCGGCGHGLQHHRPPAPGDPKGIRPCGYCNCKNFKAKFAYGVPLDDGKV